jgi:hypothetical protein
MTNAWSGLELPTAQSTLTLAPSCAAMLKKKTTLSLAPTPTLTWPDPSQRGTSIVVATTSRARLWSETSNLVQTRISVTAIIS